MRSTENRQPRRRGRPPSYCVMKVLWMVCSAVRSGLSKSEARLAVAMELGMGEAIDSFFLIERVRQLEIRARAMWRRAVDLARTEPEPEDDEMQFSTVRA